MENEFEDHARYDGPLPRRQSAFTGRACREAMLRALLHAVRLRRQGGESDAPAFLAADAKGLRKKIYEQTEGPGKGE